MAATSKPPAIDLFEIDYKSGKNWLALGKKMERQKEATRDLEQQRILKETPK